MAAGRPSGERNTREQIIRAARREFAEKGLVATSLRGIARRAGVDPALVHHYFDGKDGLFRAATVIPEAGSHLGDALDVPRDQLGEALVAHLLSVWDDPERQAALLGVIRSSVATQQAVDVLRESLAEPLARELGRAAGLVNPDRHVPYVLSQTVGLIFLRYVLRLEPLASATHQEIIATVGPTIQRYLDM